MPQLSHPQRRKIRRRARRVVESCAHRGESRCIEDVLAAVGVLLDVEITLSREKLPLGKVGYTRREGDHVLIVVSTACTTVRHTVAHEVGHLVLGHSHFDTACVADSLGQPPAGFERFHLNFMPEIGGEDQVATCRLLDRNEKEAEQFAIDLIHLTSTINHPRVAREWAYAIG